MKEKKEETNNKWFLFLENIISSVKKRTRVLDKERIKKEIVVFFKFFLLLSRNPKIQK